jgi:hypothetical protein
MRKLQIFIGIVLTGYLLSSCTKPVEDRKDLNMDGVKTKVDFSVTQKPGYDNWLYLEAKTAGAIPFWNYVAGVSNKAKDTVLQPFAGQWWIKCYAYTQAGPALDSTMVTVTKNDINYFHHRYWNLLTNGSTGKTWVWAYDNIQSPGKVRGVGPYTVGKASPYAGDNFDWTTGFDWWNSGTGNDVGEITFNLDGATNFLKTDVGVTTKGLFTMDTIAFSIKVQGTTMINAEADSDGTYFIARLTADELILCQVYSWGQRPYYFKRKGYTF